MTTRIRPVVQMLLVVTGLNWQPLVWSAERSLKETYAALIADGRPTQPQGVIPKAILDADNAAIVYGQVIHKLESEVIGDKSLFDTLAEMAARLDKSWDKELSARFARLCWRPSVQGALRELGKAQARSGCRFELDYTRGLHGRLNHLPKLRKLFDIVCAHARVCIENGATDRAWDRGVVALKLAGDLKDEPILLTQMSRIYWLERATKLLQIMAEDSAVPAENYMALDKLLMDIDSQQPLVTAFDGLRVLHGEWFFGLTDAEFLRFIRASAESDWQRTEGDHVAYIRVMHQFTNNAALPYRPTDQAFARRLMEEIPEESKYTRQLLPGLPTIKQRYAAMIARVRMTRLGLALLEHRDRVGVYPESLSMLKPYGVDPFSGAPLKYRPAAGGFTLYSVGPNHVDDSEERQEVLKDDIAWQHIDEAAIRPGN